MPRPPRGLKTRRQRNAERDARLLAESYAELNREAGMPEGTGIYGFTRDGQDIPPSHAVIYLPDDGGRYAVPVGRMGELPPRDAGEQAVLDFLDALRAGGELIVTLTPLLTDA